MDPSKALYFEYRAIEYIRLKHHWEEAIADYNQMVRLEPSNPGRYKIRGDAYFSHQDYDHAIADFSEAIRLKPTLAYCFSQRGWAYYRQKEYGRAISDFDKAIELDAKNAVYVQRSRPNLRGAQEQPARPGRFYRGGKLRANDCHLSSANRSRINRASQELR